MKKITILLAVAASVMLASCAKEDFVQSSGKYTVLSVSTGDMDKTTIGELVEGRRALYWANGDQISINGIVSDPLAGVAAESKTADFVFQTEPSAPYNTLYPAAYYKDATTVTLPSVATAMPVPVAAQGLALKPVTGVLKITVTQGTNPANLVQVQVSSATQQLSGDFTIDYVNGTLTGADATADAKTVTFKKHRALTTETPYEVFIPVPAGTYSYTVKVMDEAGNYMTKSTSADKTIQAGKIYALDSFAFNPTGTEDTTIEIASAEDLVAFAKRVNSGEFESKPWIVAKMKNDITFDETTNAAFHAENGIGIPEEISGDKDHYFYGTFDGQGYSIKGYASQYTVPGIVHVDSLVVCPIFNYTGTDSYIRNIVLDSSCDFQLPKGSFGCLAHRVKGVVENITCNAGITINFYAGTSNIGGIVGRVYGGTVRNCTMNGSIMFNTTDGTTKVWKLGGIAATVEDGGLVENCNFAGQIQWGTASAGQGPSMSNDFYIAHIVAHVMNGNVINCNATLNAKGDDIRGKGDYPYIGGIAGKVEAGCTVSGCSNAQGMYIRLSSGLEAYIGGVVGYNDGTVTNCSYVGDATKSSCYITANVGHITLSFGGVVGKNNNVLTSCTCTGYLKGPTQYKTTTKAYIGGIVGWTTVGLSDLTFNGNMNITVSDANWGSVTGIVRAVGGVVGYVEDAITLDKLTNKGFVTYSMTKKVNHSGAMVGGIVGYVNGPVTVSNCVNDGYPFNCDFDNVYAPMLNAANAGGIVGSVEGTEETPATITKCVNKKCVGNRRGIAGGIVGWAKRANITECENYAGNDAPWLVDGKEATESITSVLGGIVGRADTSAVVTNCKAENIKLCCKPATASCTIGGIVGTLLDATSQIIGCTAKNVTVEPQTEPSGTAYVTKGGIAGTSVEGSWIHSCKFSGGYAIKGNEPEPFTIFDICSDMNFDDDGNNELIEEE